MRRIKKNGWIPKKWLNWLNANTSMGEYVEAIYVRRNKEEILRDIWRKRGRMVALMLVVLFLAVVLCITREPEVSSPLEGNYLTRKENDEKVSMTVTGDHEGDNWEKEISLSLNSREFSEEEKSRLDQQVEDYLQQTLPGNNQSLDQVTEPLNLVDTMPDSGIEMTWSVDNDYLEDSGKLHYGKIPERGVDTDVMVKALWKNWKRTYHFSVHLMAKQYTEKELWERQVKSILKKTVKDQAAKERVELPEQIGNISVTYQTEEEKKSFMLVYLVLGGLLLLPFIWREQQKKKLKKREEQLLLDHPGVINKFMLLLGAGLTLRKVVERLVLEYEQERKKGGEKRYVYEEMCVMLQEMKDGASESKAMEHFGRRCRLLPYLRFASVITQNLKKGAEGLIAILEAESMEALEQRKERALQLGEKAGTKLLFPMMLMLGIVMAVIMVPAFMTM